MAPELGVAMIGHGFIGKVHTYGYVNLPFFYAPPPARIRLVAVCTAREETAQAAKREGFEFATTDFNEAIYHPGVDIVNICSPNNVHADQLIAAMRAGKHIYCDKPVTGTWEDAERVAEALRSYTGISQVTLNNRFTLPALRAKQMIEEGFLGKVTQFRAGYFHAGSVDPDKPMGWKQEAAAGGGVINDLGSHILDLINWLAGPIAEVHAETRVLYPTRPGSDGKPTKVQAEDAMTVLARLADGASGVIEASKIATGANDELRVEIHGVRGALRFNSMDPSHLEAYALSEPEAPLGGTRGWTRIDTVGRYDKPGGWPGPKFAPGWLRSHVQCLYNFVTAVAEGRPAEPSLADGIRLQRMLEIVRQSASQSAWLSVRNE